MLLEHGLSVKHQANGIGLAIRPDTANPYGIPGVFPRRPPESQRDLMLSRPSHSPGPPPGHTSRDSPLPSRDAVPISTPNSARLSHFPPSRDRSLPVTLVRGAPPEEGHGTLVLGSSGSSRYLGPTAGPEWLKYVSEGDIHAADVSTMVRMIRQRQCQRFPPHPKAIASHFPSVHRTWRIQRLRYLRQRPRRIMEGHCWKHITDTLPGSELLHDGTH